MKSLNRTSLKEVLKSTVTLVVVLLMCVNATFAQAPNCAAGNILYSLWNDSTAGNNPSEIRPINTATGAVGALMGGATVMISRTISGTPYYGSSSLGVDANRFYTNTQMGFAGGRKDFLAINTNPTMSAPVIIATTPNSTSANVPVLLSDYFFVKMAVAPFGGLGYAIGVHRDTTVGGFTPNICNPLVSFTTCGTSNCSTLKLLGFLPNAPQSHNWKIYNGDIAFNSVGDLYYLATGFEQVGGIARYTDVRLFKINAVDIPSAGGTGIIPMTFIADYNIIDSTVLNGLAFDAPGNMYISTRRYSGVQANPQPSFVNELYKSTAPGVGGLIPGYGPHTAGYSAADLASCYFPLVVLDQNILKLTSRYASGNAELTWKVNDNNRVNYFEIQRGDDGENFETIARVDVISNGHADQTYSYRDPQGGFGKPKFYRIREIMTDGGLRFYSNIARVNFNSKIDLVSKPRPNPFISYVDFDVQLKANGSVNVRLIDKSGKTLYNKTFNGHAGSNKITVDDFGHLPAGVYIAELGVEDEVVREKIIKNN
jgi:hypothetical protein